MIVTQHSWWFCSVFNWLLFFLQATDVAAEIKRKLEKKEKKRKKREKKLQELEANGETNGEAEVSSYFTSELACFDLRLDSNVVSSQCTTC